MIISGMIIGDNIILITNKNLFPYILSLCDNVNMDDVLLGTCNGGHVNMIMRKS